MWATVAVSVGILCAVAFALAQRGRRGKGSLRLKKKPLLTATESAFFARLQQALPNHVTFPQVAFAAFLTEDGPMSRKARFALRAKLNRKIADFIVCER